MQSRGLSSWRHWNATPGPASAGAAHHAERSCAPARAFGGRTRTAIPITTTGSRVRSSEPRLLSSWRSARAGPGARVIHSSKSIRRCLQPSCKQRHPWSGETRVDHRSRTVDGAEIRTFGESQVFARGTGEIRIPWVPTDVGHRGSPRPDPSSTGQTIALLITFLGIGVIANLLIITQWPTFWPNAGTTSGAGTRRSSRRLDPLLGRNWRVRRRIAAATVDRQTASDTYRSLWLLIHPA